MKNIVIQLQNVSQISNYFERIQALAAEVDTEVKITEGAKSEAENFSNIHVDFSQEPKEFWNKFKGQFLTQEDFAKNSIVVLPKDKKWDDYYLLYTFADEKVNLLE